VDRIIIGQTAEKRILNKAITSNEAEIISVIGRRRVGKTYLVRTVYKDKLAFEIPGL
jgi:AAA+ ATPase superfamily predicted ATPase